MDKGRIIKSGNYDQLLRPYKNMIRIESMEKLPSGYWELLYMSWKYDFGVIKDLIPVMARSMRE